jgi:hypothetical protein
MSEITVIKPFQSSFVSAVFVFSTMYALSYFWSLGSGQPLFNVVGLIDKLPYIGHIVSILPFGSFFDLGLEVTSDLSPWLIVKGVVYSMFNPISPDAYTFINLFFLRPIGWVFSLFTVDWLVAKIPTEGSV